jgi:DNA repair exonuclease SbcCD ATPase subunit
MKLKRLEINGFGKLVKQAYEFSPGLNLIYGRNEGGKSTLQRSILAALYGFFDDGSITAAKKAVMTAYEPWDTRAPFGLKLIFELEGGKLYRVERSFGPKAETVLYDHRIGKSINSKFSAATNGRLFFAEDLLGMPRDVFENTSLVRQAELAALEKSASAITDTLLRLSASASQESTASQAIEILEIALKEQVGTQRSRSKPLPEAQRRLEALRVARTRLLSEHQALDNQMHELAQAEESFLSLQREHDKAEYQQLLAQKMVAQQQRKTIDQADVEVERCQQVVSQYQVWSTFPANKQPKIQRLAVQYEKAQSDASLAEQTALRARQRLSGLCYQIENIHAVLNSALELDPLPDLETQSAAMASTAIKRWLDNELSKLRIGLQEQQYALSIRNTKLAGLSQVGHEGITKDRQELGKLETDLGQAKLVIQQIQLAARQAGIPEDQWDIVLSNAHTASEKWKNWRDFPAHLRDELLQLTAQYHPLHESLVSKSPEMSILDGNLNQLQTQVDALLQQITSLEKARNIPQQEKPRIQEISSQLESAKKEKEDANRLFLEIDHVYQQEQQTLDAEKQTIGPIEKLEVAGLNQLQQRWLNATQQLASAQARSVQSQDAWGKVGMPVTEFQRLENMVREIQSGVRPAPKPRRGCRSLLMPQKAEVVDQTPKEVAVYAKIQPLYAEFARQHDEIKGCEDTLHLVEEEIHQNLGLAPESIQESTFTVLIQRLQNYQQNAFQVGQRKAYRDNRFARYQEAEDHEQQIRTRLENELGLFGMGATSTDEAVEQFFEACDQKEQLLAAELNLERIQSQMEMARQQRNQFQTQQQALSQTEEKIAGLLAKAKIQNTASLQEGIQQFENGLEGHRQWKLAQSHLEQVQLQVSDFKARLSEARSTVNSKEEILFDFRKNMSEKFPELLSNGFTDQDLAQLDADLQAVKAAQSNLDKAQIQLEQLQLQAQTLQQEIDDWQQKDEAVKLLGDEILQTVHDVGQEIDQVTVADALRRFDEAWQGFTLWQQAQRTYESAVQAQQAVHSSLAKLESELANLETKITLLTKQHPEWKSLIVSDKPEVYERNSQKINEQLLQERDRMIRLQDSVNRGTKNLKHLAELDEEIDLANTEVQRLTYFSQALELASSELTIATREFQKMFAPRLEQIVESGLEQITAGRYRQVKIDPNSLSVRILSPERNELVDTAQLSTGTRDLIYLVLRMGISQLMSSSGEKLPLLLDDPLVEFDSLRQKGALEYLKDLSNQTQVLLFTKDETVKEWFQLNGLSAPHGNLIELS